MAGAERVEGTLFGNGERTGNVDIVTLALNLLTQGVDPGSTCRRSTRRRRSSRSATSCRSTRAIRGSGELVYTAFSGSHQDAIKKGMYAQQRSRLGALGRARTCRSTRWTSAATYEAIIRVNSQSGKGGVAYLMETEHHLELPRGLQVDFAQKVQAITDARGDELTADELLAAFHEHYLSHDAAVRARLVRALERRGRTGSSRASTVDGEPQEVDGRRQRADRGARRRVRAALRDRDPDPRLPRARDGGERRRDRGGLRRGRRRRRRRLGRRAPPEHRRRPRCARS